MHHVTISIGMPMKEKEAKGHKMMDKETKKDIKAEKKKAAPRKKSSPRKVGKVIF